MTPGRLRVLHASIVALPFGLFYWLLPFAGGITLGHDYRLYPIHHQMEQQYSLARGSWPLYAPGFAGGRSAPALTLGGLHHPLPNLAARSPGYWSGLALEWNTFWRLLSLGLAHLALFAMTRRLGLAGDAAFIVSFLTVYNLRMLDLFRYGAALENYTGFLFLCAALLHLWIARDRLVGPAAVIGSTYLTVCGGHPQMAYLGMLGALLLGAFLPAVSPLIRPDLRADRAAIVRFAGTAAACIVTGLLLSAAYALPFAVEFLGDAPARVGKPYAWSLGNSVGVKSALAGFFNPLFSNVHASIGSSSLILLALLGPLALAATGGTRGRGVLLALSAAMMVVFALALGAATPLHRVFWEVVPFASSFRTPGRLLMLLIPLFLLALAWVFREARPGPEALPPWLPAIQTAVLFVVGSAALLLSGIGDPLRTPFGIHGRPGWMAPFAFACGLAALLLAALRLSASRHRAAAGLLLAAVVVIQGGVQLRHGIWLAERKATPTLEQMDLQKRETLAFRGKEGYGMASSSLLPPSAASGPKVFLETSSPADRVASTHASFNRMNFRSESAGAVVLVFSEPYSTRWRAWVDSHEVSVGRTELNQLAVPVPAGIHDVEFRYASPASWIGMSISALTLLLAGLCFAMRVPRGRARSALMAAALLLPAAGWSIWARSLYHADDVGTRHVWPSTSK